MPIGNRAPSHRETDTDKDGWGADAPQVTRSQLEKVAPAYKPTKVDLNEIRSQASSTTSGFSKTGNDQDGIIGGGYQPVGKVDIASLRKGYREERPEPVKGSYTPVDVGSIRKAPPARPEPEARPVHVTERTGAFNNQNSQSERLTSLPKPKVTNKFGTGSAANFGTKPLSFDTKPIVPPPVQIGSINKTGSSKTPSQLWAEKKARERGLSGASETAPPTMSPTTTGQQQHLTPSYTGASASSQQHEEERSTPSTSMSELRNRFSGSIPAQRSGGFSPQQSGGFSPQRSGGFSATSNHPPPIESSSRPSFGAPMDVGRPARSYDREEVPATTSAFIPSPPVQPRSPTPPTPTMPSSPVRLAIPVAREEPEFFRPSEPAETLPTASLSRVVPREEDLTDEPSPSHGAVGGQRAVVLYDYTADEENEINLVEGQVVTEIDMVDEDWWRGTNALGATGLFPSNYVELIQGGAEAERAPSPEPAAAAPAAPVAKGRTATAVYDYEATEENELSFPEGAVIKDVQFPDEDWWHGVYNGKDGLFVSSPPTANWLLNILLTVFDSRRTMLS